MGKGWPKITFTNIMLPKYSPLRRKALKLKGALGDNTKNVL
jgi:hypothetical protein